MSRAKLVDYYLNKMDDDFRISQVREDLERNHFDEEEIKIIVRLVDNALQRKLADKENNRKATELMVMGAVIAIVGAGITIGTYMAWIDMGNSYVILYGPFVGGLSLFAAGWAKRKRT